MAKDIKLIHTTYELQAALDEKRKILQETIPFARIIVKNGIGADGLCKNCTMTLDGEHEEDCIVGRAVRFVELGGIALPPKAPNRPLTRGDLRRIRKEKKLAKLALEEEDLLDEENV